ncbi:MAG TPA: TIGR02266 family protein [Polyangia bacterium]|nr:TIGR02266 family protein [Polyangia bacterium]
MGQPLRRREHQRVALEVEVTLESDHNFYAGVVDDVSEGGVFVATHVPPPVGAAIDLLLTLPGRPQPFACSGVVRWIRDLYPESPDAPNGCGIQWSALSTQALAAIRAFVASRSTLLYEAA